MSGKDGTKEKDGMKGCVGRDGMKEKKVRGSVRAFSGVLKQWVQHFLQLWFPPCCAACDRPLVENERFICLECQYHLPITNFHVDSFNEGVQLIGGQFPLDFVACFLRFEERSRVQNIVHQFKYFGNKQLGFSLGQSYGNLLKKNQHPCLSSDALIPIPAQGTTKKKRGYNQSQVFAEGLATELNLPIISDVLYKLPSVESQVGKGRAARFDNLEQAYQCIENEGRLQGKKVILVDDVLTTGATISSCANALFMQGVTSVGVIALARKRNR